MKKTSFSLIYVIIVVLGLLSHGYSEKGLQVQEERFALVIGNGNYKSSPLRNPTNDAHDMALILKTMGFEVTLLENAEHMEMERAIRKLGEQLRNGGTGLFYFAGHGIQINGRNYLIPVDAEIETESDVRFEAVDAGRVLGKMEDAKNEMNIVVLDACRDNPFSRSFRTSNRGLARMDAPKGSLIAYATAPGSIAADGEGRNGIFTKYLLNNLITPGLTVEQILKRTRIDVLKDTNDKQIPWESSSLTGNFYFNPVKSSIKTSTSELQKKVKIAQQERPGEKYETLFWESVKDSKDIDKYNEYLSIFPNGIFAGLAKLEIQNLLIDDSIVDKRKKEGKSELVVTISNMSMANAIVYLRKKDISKHSTDREWIDKGNTPLKIEIDPGLYDIKVEGISSGYIGKYSGEINIESGKRVSIKALLRFNWESLGKAEIVVSDI
ncbi:MAG: caspase family protein [Nitrospinales bacterium]